MNKQISEYFSFIMHIQVLVHSNIPIEHHNIHCYLQILRLVSEYIASAETIIMVVVACNSEIATTKALKLANQVDPHGVRTLGKCRLIAKII